MKRTIASFISALLIFVLFATLVPVGAQGLRTYRKAAWGLTLQYPDGWQVDQDTPDVVDVNFNNGYDDLAGMTIVRNSIYTDPNYSLEDALWDAAAQAEVDVQDVQVQPGTPVTIAGVRARSATWTGVISGVAMEGDVYVFAKGNDGFAIVTVMLTATWELHLDQLDAILSSIKIGATTPTRTPTRRARRPSPTPTKSRGRPKATATPTEEPIEEPTAEVTEEPIEEPTIEVTEEPIEEPTVEVTEEPIEEPTVEVTEEPIEEPTIEVTEGPIEEPTEEITEEPTEAATEAVSPTATAKPTRRSEAVVPVPKRATPTAAISATPAVTATVAASPTRAVTPTLALTSTPIVTATVVPTAVVTPTVVLTNTSTLTPTTALTTTGSLTGTLPVPITGSAAITS